MDKPDTDLKYLYIKVQLLDKSDQFEYKNVFKILEKKDTYELVALQMWITNSILEHIGWDLINLNVETVARALMLFDALGIKPKNYIYDEKGDLLDGLD